MAGFALMWVGDFGLASGIPLGFSTFEPVGSVHHLWHSHQDLSHCAHRCQAQLACLGFVLWTEGAQNNCAGLASLGTSTGSLTTRRSLSFAKLVGVVVIPGETRPRCHVRSADPTRLVLVV